MSKALEFDEIASRVFAPIYPVLAEQIVERTRMRTGACLDLGCGGGHLGLALAALTRFQVTLYDISREALELAEERIKTGNMEGRITTVEGDVRRLPFAEDTFDLIVSRGSVWFWSEQTAAFQEIYRVLAPGGQVYIGGGFGTAALKRQIVTTMARREPDWEERIKRYRSGHTVETFTTTLQKAGIDRFIITDDDSGFWIRFTKALAFKSLIGMS